jgi:hypothetical protein
VTIADVEEQVRDTYWDWRGLLVNPRYCRQGLRVSWNRYAVGIIREPINYEKVRSLVETKQFSFQCAEDGSVFQLLYQFASDDDLELARLAFYKAHVQLGEDIDLSRGCVSITQVNMRLASCTTNRIYISVVFPEPDSRSLVFPDPASSLNLSLPHVIPFITELTDSRKMVHILTKN